MRLTLDIPEVAALISACDVALASVSIEIRSARKLNNLAAAANASMEFVDLSTAKDKLLSALKESTTTKEN